MIGLTSRYIVQRGLSAAFIPILQNKYLNKYKQYYKKHINIDLLSIKIALLYVYMYMINVVVALFV